MFAKNRLHRFKLPFLRYYDCLERLFKTWTTFEMNCMIFRHSTLWKKRSLESHLWCHTFEVLYNGVEMFLIIFCYRTMHSPSMQISRPSGRHLVPSSTFSVSWTTIASSDSMSWISSSSAPTVILRLDSSILVLLSLVPSVDTCSPRQIKAHGLSGSWCGNHFSSCPLYGMSSNALHCSARKSLKSSHGWNN